MQQNSAIDFVITWVDGNDSNWQAEKAKYQQKGDTRKNRYRDWELLRYWFRAIEKNAPWFNHLYFVTWGHVPAWLNVNHPKITIVKHEDFIPSQYLPTFSCRPIELNLHRIEGLEEKFVYFNDDMFLLNPVAPNDFFKKGLPCDTAVVDATSINEVTNDGKAINIQSLYTTLIFNTVVINRNFNKRKVIRENWRKWYSLKNGKDLIRTLLLTPWVKFTGFKSPHLPYSYLKSTFEDLWSKEEQVLNTACEHKFRDPLDVSSRLFSYWQLAQGSFEPRSPRIGVSTSISENEDNNRKICDLIKHRSYKMICINDDYHGNDFESVKRQFIDAFESIYPQKSTFETEAGTYL